MLLTASPVLCKADPYFIHVYILFAENWGLDVPDYKHVSMVYKAAPTSRTFLCNIKYGPNFLIYIMFNI